MFTLLFIVTLSVLFSSHPTHHDHNNGNAYIHQSVLGLRSDPLKTRLDLVYKQANDHIALVNAYAAYARKLKLDISKQLKMFEDLAKNFSDLQSKPTYRTALFDTDGPMDDDSLRQFEKEVKDKVKFARLLISDSKESYDNQLKIQKLKDTIFSVNELLVKAKKNGALASSIAAKSTPKSLHCLAMRLMEERISHPEKYRDDGPKPEFEDPTLYHYAIFSDNVIAVSMFVNSVIKNAEEPWKHVFHIVANRMNLAAMKVWFKMRPIGEAHIEIKAVEDFKFLKSSYVPVLRQLESPVSSNSIIINGQLRENGLEEEVKKSEFPDGFLFGTSTSAYQIEGAFLEDGRSLSNWDVYSHLNGSIRNGGNGDIADDHYHRYLEDIDIMESLGVNAYRFSISWSRVLPRGRLGPVNPAAIKFYNNVIDNLLLKGITPFVTIHHNDYPQELEDRYGAWLSPLMQDEFVHFASTCFKSFGNRVKYWATINEPNLFAELAYMKGIFPPSHCSPPFGKCTSGNSDIEPLIVVHNSILAHAKAVKIYRDLFQVEQGGMIGMIASAYMYKAMTDDEVDKKAANRALTFRVAWLLDPLVHGDYPIEMQHYHGRKLPRFSSEEKLLIKNSTDFIGLNHYSTWFVKDCLHSNCTCMHGENHAILGFLLTDGQNNDGEFIGDPMGLPGLYVVPQGMEDIVEYIKNRYNNIPIFVTENGYASNDDQGGGYDLDKDMKRIKFHKAYLESLARSIRNGADVRGYFIWSLMDNFEWKFGYTIKYGLYYVDPLTLDRSPKLSAHWYRDFLTNSSLNNNIQATSSIYIK